MNSLYNEYKDLLEGIGFPAVLAIAGGFLRCLRGKVTSWRHFVRDLITSGFVGVIAHLYLSGTDMPLTMQAALVSTSGYAGAVIMDAAVERILSGIRNFPGPGGWDGIERRSQERGDGDGPYGSAEGGLERRGSRGSAEDRSEGPQSQEYSNEYGSYRSAEGESEE